MIETLLLSAFIVLLAVVGMALGVLCGRGRLRRGCAMLRADGESGGGCGGCERARPRHEAKREEVPGWRP